MNRKTHMVVISTVLSKLDDFSRSPAVTYTVLISRKRCKI